MPDHLRLVCIRSALVAALTFVSISCGPQKQTDHANASFENRARCSQLSAQWFTSYMKSKGYTQDPRVTLSGPEYAYNPASDTCLCMFQIETTEESGDPRQHVLLRRQCAVYDTLANRQLAYMHQVDGQLVLGMREEQLNALASKLFGRPEACKALALNSRLF